MQTQQGGTDCGVFAIAMATSLGCGDDPARLTFQQENLREHLLKCLESGNLTVFPVATYLIISIYGRGQKVNVSQS